MQPIVLVTTDRRQGQGFADVPRVRPRRDEAYVLEAYVQAVREAGGVPLLLPPGEVPLSHVLSRVDAVVLTGGDMDIHPSHYGESVEGRLDRVEPARTELELSLARACLDGDVPVLGVCGGMQVLAVAAGGTLVQDLPGADADHLAHEQLNDPAEPSHPLRLTQADRLGLPAQLQINSTHHQAVKSPGSLTVVGTAPDGVVEAVLATDHRYAVGVQWHPELIGQLGPYKQLVAAAQR